MSNDQRADLLISLKLSGEATPDELKELDQLLLNDPAVQERLDMMDKVWHQLNRRPSGLAAEQFEKHLHKLNTQVFENKHADGVPYAGTRPGLVRKLFSKRSFRLLSGAAAVVIACCWFFFRNSEMGAPQPVVSAVSTKAGDKASINLPDGTKVWLNGDSRITYSEDIKNRTREVSLSGEAFFEVAKDKTKPFIIHTKTINLKVLGTAFNVRSYDNEKETETSLVHGSVEVTLRNRPDQKILLKPGEKLLVKNNPADSLLKNKKQKADDEAPIAVLTTMHYYGTDSSSVETSWTKNKLVFNDDPLDKIALNIERWFNVQVIITDESLKKEKYTATIEEDDKLEDFLEALKLAEGFRYYIKKGEVVISR